jgi:hypothetical protein
MKSDGPESPRAILEQIMELAISNDDTETQHKNWLTTCHFVPGVTKNAYLHLSLISRIVVQFQLVLRFAMFSSI